MKRSVFWLATFLAAVLLPTKTAGTPQILNFGEPRTVRLLYFLPNNRQFRAEVVQKMKDEIQRIQIFYAQQMQAHGYGNNTFRFESDAQGMPIVHRVDGERADHSYLPGDQKVVEEIERLFDMRKNIYWIVLDTGTAGLGGQIQGIGRRVGKNGGYALVPDAFHWTEAAHELGHAFGLLHDFKEDDYLMSYGKGRDRLSACAAAFLATHLYFNPEVNEENNRENSQITLLSSPEYSAGSKIISVQFEANDPDGLRQVLLFTSGILKGCRQLNGEKDAVIEFDYDGAIPSNPGACLGNPASHTLLVVAVDIFGNAHPETFHLSSVPTTTEADGERVVEIQDDNARRAIERALGKSAGAPITADDLANVTSLEHRNDQALTQLTLPEGLIHLCSLRLDGNALTELTLPNEMTNLRSLDLSRNSMTNFTLPEGMTNLRQLWLAGNSLREFTLPKEMTNLRSLWLSGNSLREFTLPKEMTNLRSLWLAGNSLREFTLPEGMTNLRSLWLAGNSLRDFSFLKRLTRLRELNLSGDALRDDSFVEGLTNLRDLYLSGEAPNDFDFLKKLPNLERLNLESLTFSGNALSRLPDGLDNLRFLSIRNIPLNGWTLPTGLSNLVWLYLRGNSMTELILPEDMASLKVLNLEGSSLTRLSAHRNFDIENLNLSGFPKKNIAFYGSPSLTILPWKGSMLEILWNGREILQSSATFTGKWESVEAASSPYRISPTGSARFFRLQPQIR